MPRETLASLREARQAWVKREHDLLTALEAARQPITDMKDKRLTPVWDRAHQSANEHNHCEEFDDIMDDIGAPARKRDVQIEITLRGEVRMSDEYGGRMQEWFRTSFPRIFPNLSVYEFEFDYRD